MFSEDTLTAATQLESLGEEALKAHLPESARRARDRYGRLRVEHLTTFLNDPECVRYPTRIVFEFDEMADRLSLISAHTVPRCDAPCYPEPPFTLSGL
jgi:hypothetical protein